MDLRTHGSSASACTAQEAIAARDQTNGYKLDRSHTFAVTLFDDFERYARVPDEYQDPEAKPYQPTVRGGDYSSDFAILSLLLAEATFSSASDFSVGH